VYFLPQSIPTKNGQLFRGQRTLILLGAFGLELKVPEVDEILLAADYKQLVLPQSLR